MNSNHDCISKVRKELKNESPEMGWVKFDCSNVHNMNDPDPIYKTGQRFEYSYRHTKKDGTIIEKIGKSFISHDFCPFCGEEYVKD